MSTYRVTGYLRDPMLLWPLRSLPNEPGLRWEETPSFHVNEPTTGIAAEAAFRLLNADDRPNGAYQRPLSVGDAVRVASDGGEEWWYVEALGFARGRSPLEE